MASFTNIIEYNDVDEPINFRKFKKTVHTGKEWEDRVFYELRENVDSIVRWLEEKYGKGRYCDTWWKTYNSVAMSEKIYTHYALCV